MINRIHFNTVLGGRGGGGGAQKFFFFKAERPNMGHTSGGAYKLFGT